MSAFTGGSARLVGYDGYNGVFGAAGTRLDDGNSPTKIARNPHADDRDLRQRACQHCSIERRGLRRQRNFFLICCLILHSALLAQRVCHGNSDPSNISVQHPWLNVIAPAVWAPQPVAALHSSSRFKQQRRRRLLVSMRCTTHGYMGNACVAAWAICHAQQACYGGGTAAAFFNTYSPASGCAMCAPHVIFARFCPLFAQLFAHYRLSTTRAKRRCAVAGVVFKASAASFRCPGGRNTGIQET